LRGAGVRSLRLNRIFWIGAATILVAAALVALSAVVRGDFSETDGRILGTLAVLLYTGGALLAGLALLDRGRDAWLGWATVAASPVALALVLRAVWEWGGDGEDDNLWRPAWSAALVLLAGLIASTALLLAKREALAWLARGAGALATLAALLSVAAIWDESPGDALAKLLGALWILAALAYFLVPVLERFTEAGEPVTEARVLAVLDGVELVAARGSVEGIEVEPPGPGERLVLRRRIT
jgi:hypothetical protein